MLRIGEDQPGDGVGQQLDNLFLFPLPAVVIVNHQSLIAVFEGDGFDAGQQIGKDLVVEGRDQHADARLLGRSRLIAVGEVNFFHHLGNFRSRFGSHLVRRAQIAADGHFGHTGEQCNILQRDALVLHLGALTAWGVEIANSAMLTNRSGDNNRRYKV
ncbi:hypothetical protein D3C80_1326870 [compost metagenome]